MTRQEAIDILGEYHVNFEPYNAEDIVCAIDMAIEALTKESKTGYWIENDNGTFSCSNCQSWIPEEQYHYARFCLHCGARMESDEQ